MKSKQNAKSQTYIGEILLKKLILDKPFRPGSYTLSELFKFFDYKKHTEKEIIQVKTVRQINPGEELTINYNGDWNNEKKVWFDALI